MWKERYECRDCRVVCFEDNIVVRVWTGNDCYFMCNCCWDNIPKIDNKNRCESIAKIKTKRKYW